MKKKNIGGVIGLYPTPATVIGVVIDKKVNWMNAAHVGILGMEHIVVSINKNHYTSTGLEVGGYISVNLVNEDMLIKADYVGLVSGKKVDKSDVFDYILDSNTQMPIINEAPLTMACEIISSFITVNHENWVLKPINTHVRESYLDHNGKVDFELMSPILFDMQKARYLSVGGEVAKCWSIGQNYIK